MSVHQDYPENVLSAKQGTADSLAAPGRVGAGGTKRTVIFFGLVWNLCFWSLGCSQSRRTVLACGVYCFACSGCLVYLCRDREEGLSMISVSQGKPGEGMQYCNRAAWMSVADFLARQNLRQVLKARAQAAAARGPACGDASAAGEARSIPVGNHGDISATGRNV